MPLMERTRASSRSRVAGVVIGILALVFAEITDKSPDEVLFSGQDQVSGLISSAGSWSLGALALLIVLKGIGYAISLAGFRGGPTFPAMFLGVAAGLMAAELPGFADHAGRRRRSRRRRGRRPADPPLSAVVLAALLTSTTGLGSSPLIIVGVVVAYLTTIGLSGRKPSTAGDAATGAEAAPTTTPTSPPPLTASR